MAAECAVAQVAGYSLKIITLHLLILRITVTNMKKEHKHTILSILLLILFTSCGAKKETVLKLNPDEIQVKWVENLSGNFSFKDNWSYPEGVYRNESGQLVCDGICPPEIDTTHLFHSIKSEAWANEWAGTDFIIVERVNKDTVIGFTQNNAGTHSRLNLVISPNTVKPTIIVNSVTTLSYEEKIYNHKGGQMIIDKKHWEKGILKAVFDFEFYNDDNSGKKMYWKGNIYAKIEKK